MQLKPSVMEYLDGRAFSNGLLVDFDLDEEDYVLRSRISWLQQICCEKDVIHAGCVDHGIHLIEHKRRRKKWLHAALCERARRCHGIDRDGEGIVFLRDELGFDDVECLDLVNETSRVIESNRWDYLVLGELLEHVDDPVAFLQSIRQRYARHVADAVITVPNAFARENFRLARRGLEGINTDHRYWFTPYTLAKVATRAGLVIRYLRLCRNGVVKRRSFLKNAYLRRHPFLRNNIILVAALSR
jgi:hypothetical protein